MNSEDGFEFIRLYMSNRWTLLPEARDWLVEHVGPGGPSNLHFIIDPVVKWCTTGTPTGTEVWFKDEQSALLFKLTWAGT